MICEPEQSRRRKKKKKKEEEVDVSGCFSGRSLIKSESVPNPRELHECQSANFAQWPTETTSRARAHSRRAHQTCLDTFLSTFSSGSLLSAPSSALPPSLKPSNASHKGGFPRCHFEFRIVLINQSFLYPPGSLSEREKTPLMVENDPWQENVSLRGLIYAEHWVRGSS